MELSILVRLVDRKVMKHYFSGENLNCLCRYYYVSRTCILSLAEDYKSGKIDIFDEKEDNDEVLSQRVQKAPVPHVPPRWTGPCFLGKICTIHIEVLMLGCRGLQVGLPMRRNRIGSDILLK